MSEGGRNSNRGQSINTEREHLPAGEWRNGSYLICGWRGQGQTELSTRESHSPSSNMEFAPVSLQPYGTPGQFISAYDMRAVGNALPDYARYGPANQNSYLQSQQLEYANQAHPPFPGQPSNVFQTQHQGHYNIDFGRNHLHNITSPGVNNHGSHVGAFSQQHYIQRPSYLQIPSNHSYVSQQESRYQQNMPQQMQRPNIYPSHPSQYVSSGRNSSQSECCRKSIETTLTILSR